MFVAIRFCGVDAARLDGDIDARVLRVRLVVLNRARELSKTAAYFAQQVAHLKGDFRVTPIDLERADGDGGGGLRGHVCLLRRSEGRHYVCYNPICLNTY